MAYLGKHPHGSAVLLAVACVDPDGVPTVPDAAPTVAVYTKTGNGGTANTMVAAHKDIDSSGAFRGLFKLRWRGTLGTGPHSAIYSWVIGGVTYHKVDTLQRVYSGGGSSSGTVLAMAAVPQHGLKAVQYDTEDGVIWHGRNPK